MAVSKNSKSTSRTKATSAAEWRKQGASQLPLIETPTGKFIRLRRPGMTKFLEAGFLPDSLADVVRAEISNATRKQVDIQGMLSKLDGNAVVDMLSAQDRIVAAVMVEPPVVVHQRPQRQDDGTPARDAKGRELWEDIPAEERRDDVVYTDEIDQEDKNFIFRVAAGGSSDLTRFRSESAAVMDTVSAITGLAEAPERTPAPGE